MRFVLVPAVFGLTMFGLLWPGSCASAAVKQVDSHFATVRVLLPKDATLTIDGKPALPKTGTRRLITLPLQKGKKARFTFQAEFIRGQQTITVRRKVTLRAGQKKVVSFRNSRRYARSSEPSPVYSYRFTVEHSYDPAYGTHSYRDMRAYTPGGDRP